MNRHVRYFFLSLLFFIMPVALQASQLLSYAGMCTARTLVDLSMLPVAFGGRPITSLQKLLHDKLVPKDRRERSRHRKKRKTKTKKTLPQPVQRIFSGHSNDQNEGENEGQSVELIDIPAVIHETMATVNKESDAPVYLNLNLNNQQVASTATQKKQPPVAKAIPIEAPETSWMHRSKKYIKEKYARIISWISQHKIRFTLFCSGSFLVSFHCYMWYITRTLSNPDCWSTWRSHCSLHSLYQMDQKEMLNGLIQDLQKKYGQDNPLTVIQQFLDEANQELSLLNRYKMLCSVAQKWPIKYLMFINKSLIETIPGRSERLSFIKNAALGWLRTRQETYTYENLFKSPTKQPMEIAS